MGKTSEPEVLAPGEGNGRALVPADRGAITQQFQAMLALVPDAVDDDGFGIFANLVEAESWEDFNQPSKLPDAVAMAGRRIKVTELAKRESDLAEGFSHYLIVDGIDANTGEVLRFQTSSVGVAVPLIKLHGWGNLPALVTIGKAEKPTKAGYYPLNLQVHAVEPRKG